MGVGLLFGLAILFLLLIIGIVFIARSIKKKSKIGLVFSSLIVVFVILVLFVNKIDQFTHSKEDVKNDLRILEIEVQGDFKIVSNYVYGMPERFQDTKVEVSEIDKNQIIREIVESDNYLSFPNMEEFLKDTIIRHFRLDDSVYNFSYSGIYFRETYGRIDNYPTKLFLTVYDSLNIIEYSRIED